MGLVYTYPIGITIGTIFSLKFSLNFGTPKSMTANKMYTQSKHERAVSKKLNSFRSSLVQSTAIDKMLPIQVCRVNQYVVLN